MTTTMAMATSDQPVGAGFESRGCTKCPVISRHFAGGFFSVEGRAVPRASALAASSAVIRDLSRAFRQLCARVGVPLVGAHQIGDLGRRTIAGERVGGDQRMTGGVPLEQLLAA